LDRLFVVTHCVTGYFDLVTDILSIIQFKQQGNFEIMGLNIAFLVANNIMDVALMNDNCGRIMSVLQIQQFVQAVETLRTNKQTESFVRSKKVDAICRSVPSTVLQIYGLLIGLASGELSSSGATTLIISVVGSVMGAAMTLGQLAPRSGDSITSSAFMIMFSYYVAEFCMRLLSIALLFVSIGPLACIPLGFDLFMRWLLNALNGCEGACCEDVCNSKGFVATLMQMGSDSPNGPDEMTLVMYGPASTGILIISLAIFNGLRNATLDGLRSTAAGRSAMAGVTAIACIGCAFEYIIAGIVVCAETPEHKPVTPDEDEDKDKDKDQAEPAESGAIALVIADN